MEAGLTAARRSRSVADTREDDGAEMTECVKMLRDKLRRAQDELDKLNEKLSAKKDYRLGSGDSTIYEWEMGLARRKRVEGRIESIEKALERASKDSYGVCEMCGRMIRLERLEVLPFTTLCIECARARE